MNTLQATNDRPVHTYPPFLTVEEAAAILRVGRTCAYQLARQFEATDGDENRTRVLNSGSRHWCADEPGDREFEQFRGGVACCPVRASEPRCGPVRSRYGLALGATGVGAPR